MKVKVVRQPRATIQAFADKHRLVMEVHERPLSLQKYGRFFAHFCGAEILGDGVLLGAYGNGQTPEEAIAAYAKEISGKRLCLDARRTTRRGIDVPILVPKARRKR